MAEKIGKYEVLELIGRGGMGMIFKARDPVLDRPVALKVISSLEITPELRARFYREAQACARLSHPNIVTIYDMGEDDGRLFIVMELLEGEELRRLIARRAPLALADKLAIVRQICEGLSYAHEKGVVHRDIKPANIFLLRSGRVKILDFGIAQIAAAATHGELTRTGMIMGTLRYIAPEQVRGRADHRSDIFSVAAVSYELFGGRPPFTGDDPLQILEQIRTATPPLLTELDPSLPSELAAVLERAMQKEPGDRFADLQQMNRQLERIQRSLVEHPETEPVGKGAKPVARMPILVEEPGLPIATTTPTPVGDQPEATDRVRQTVAAAQWEAERTARRAPLIAIGTGAAIAALAVVVLYWLFPSTPRGAPGDKPVAAAVSNAGADKSAAVDEPRSPEPTGTPGRVEGESRSVEMPAPEAKPPEVTTGTSAPPSPPAAAPTKGTDRVSPPAREQPVAAAPSRARQDAEQARLRMTDARRGAERVAAVFFAPKRFTEAQSKERDGMAALAKSDYGAASGLFAEAQSEYQAAAKESAQEEERVRRLAAERTSLDEAHALVAARRQEALAAEADNLARDLFDRAQARQVQGDRAVNRKDLAAAERAYREAAERYGEAALKARAARSPGKATTR